MCADSLTIHHNWKDAWRTLANLSVKTPIANVLGVWCKTLGGGHNPIVICGKALWTRGAGAASGKMVPWG